LYLVVLGFGVGGSWGRHWGRRSNGSRSSSNRGNLRHRALNSLLVGSSLCRVGEWTLEPGEHLMKSSSFLGSLFRKGTNCGVVVIPLVVIGIILISGVDHTFMFSIGLFVRRSSINNVLDRNLRVSKSTAIVSFKTFKALTFLLIVVTVPVSMATIRTEVSGFMQVESLVGTVGTIETIVASTLALRAGAMTVTVASTEHGLTTIGTRVARVTHTVSIHAVPVAKASVSAGGEFRAVGTSVTGLASALPSIASSVSKAVIRAGRLVATIKFLPSSMARANTVTLGTNLASTVVGAI